MKKKIAQLAIKSFLCVSSIHTHKKPNYLEFHPTPLLMYELSETSRRKWTKQAANKEQSDTHGRQKSLEHHI